MNIFEIKQYSFTYPQEKAPALNAISLSLEEGKFYVLCGENGSGKSTLLRQLKTALTPKGEKSGEILYQKRALEEVSSEKQSAQIGFVFQNPDNQIVTDKVWHELAFGLESLGYEQQQIHLRVAEMASYFGITDWFHKNVSELSGGQKQLLNLASVMVMHPKILLLDEPASQLDPVAASNFLNTLHKINRELGVTVLLSEHNLEEVMSFADELLVMEKGSLLAQGTPLQIGKILQEQKHKMFWAMSTPMRIYAKTDSQEECPYTVAMGRQWLEKELAFCGSTERHFTISDNVSRAENNENIEKNASMDKGTGSAEKEGTYPVLSVKNLSFRYDKSLPDVLQDISLDIRRGETFALMGGNGTGKTTLLHLMAGILKPGRGEIYVKGQKITKYRPQELYHGLLSVLPQDPTSLFVKKTVKEEIKSDLTRKNQPEDYEEVITFTQIASLQQQHPYDLSGGQQQRVALAKIMLRHPEIVLMDEPTKGFDARFKQEFGKLLKEWNRRGITVVLVSHDLEFCAQYADRVGLCFDGEITAVKETRAFFAGNHFYTTAANRMARQYFPDAITAEEVVQCLTSAGRVDKTDKIEDTPDFVSTDKAEIVQAAEYIENSDDSETAEYAYEIDDNETAEYLQKIDDSETAEYAQNKKEICHKKGKTVCFLLAVFLLTPLTIWLGAAFFEDRKYLVISLLIALYATVPFLGLLSRQKHSVQKLVVIAVMTALAVAGRAAFFMVPAVKPVAAIVIVTGISLGAESGFLIGTLSILVSNMLFGQGPWTPWQMFAMGLIGMLAGILAEKNILTGKKISMCVYGFLTPVLIYGGIINPASLIMMSYEITPENLTAIYLSGLPLDLVHAVTTVVILAIAGNVMLEKLERVKARYDVSFDKIFGK